MDQFFFEILQILAFSDSSHSTNGVIEIIQKYVDQTTMTSTNPFRTKLNFINHIRGKLTEYLQVFDGIREDVLKQQVLHLQKHKQYPQKTPEWYKVRNEMFTASSDVCKILNQSKYGSSQDAICKKINGGGTFKGNKFTRFGNKYEQIGIQIYESRYNKTVISFGLLSHPSIAWLGASPDGITTDGRLIEIKVPFTRELTGEVLTEYFVQMQTQMEVCDLDVCDFLECKITEYLNKHHYDQDVFDETQITFLDIIPRTTDLNLVKVPQDRRTADGLEKGMIGRVGYYSTGDNNQYFYPPMDMNSMQQYSWLLDKQEQLKKEHNLAMHIDYWKLETNAFTEVCRDRKWWQMNQVEAKLADAWSQVQTAKKT